jgi:hypothetical protein
MPVRVNALREPLLTLLMRVEIRLDRRNQLELSPSLDVWRQKTRAYPQLADSRQPRGFVQSGFYEVGLTPATRGPAMASDLTTPVR